MIVYCFSEIDADNIFDDACITAIRSIKCFPKMPIHLKAKRSIIIKNLDDMFKGVNSDDIKKEINTSNTELVIVDVFKFSNSRMMKITCINQEVANIILKDGLKMFNLSLHPIDMEREQFHDIKICYKCYALDNHFAEECMQSAEYKICSNCSKTDHTYRDCTSTVKCCINCHGPHSTLSFACQKRKDIIKNIRTNQASNSRTYSMVTRSSDESNAKLNQKIGDVATIPKLDSTIINDNIIKSIMCLFVSAMKKKECSGSFETTLRELQTINKVPDFELGDVELSPNTILNFTNNIKETSDIKLDEKLNEEVMNLSVNGMRAESIDVRSEREESIGLVVPSTSEAVSSMGGAPSTSTALSSVGVTPSTSTAVSSMGGTRRKNASPRRQDFSAANFKLFKNKPLKLNLDNFKKHFYDGNLTLKNDIGISQEQCVEYLLKNPIECKRAITSAKLKDDRSLRSGNVSNMS